ncbi:MAG: peptidase, partial [Gemmatimonas sp. SG8_17]
GAVEIGGFHPKFFSQNGPPQELERWAQNEALFNLEMALHLPQIDDVETRVRVHRGDDSTSYEVTVSWTNSGELPTALRQAQLVKIVQEDRVSLQFDSELTTGESPKLRIVTPGGRDKVIAAGWTEPGERKSVRFEVRTYGVSGVEGEVHVMSTRGGMLKVPLVLGESE